MDRTLERFRAINWRFADRDPDALGKLQTGIDQAGKERSLITYSELVRDVEFNLPNVKRSPFKIDVGNWIDFERTVVGDFLGYISLRSYERHGFFASALVVGKMDGSPGWGFYSLLKDLQLIPRLQSERALDIWAEHVAKAHTWYAHHPDRLPSRRNP